MIEIAQRMFLSRIGNNGIIRILKRHVTITVASVSLKPTFPLLMSSLNKRLGNS